MTIAVLATLSAPSFAASLPSDLSQTQTLSGEYTIDLPEITINKNQYLYYGTFKVDETDVSIALSQDTSINVVHGEDSYGDSLFVNNTDHNLTFNGGGNALSIVQQSNSFGTMDGGFISGKNIYWENLSSLKIKTDLTNHIVTAGTDGFFSALFLTGESSIVLANDSSTENSVVDIGVNSTERANRLYGVALNCGQLTISNADQVNISLNLNKHTDGKGQVNSSAGIAFVSDSTEVSEPTEANKSSVFDAGEAVLHVQVTRADGDVPIAGIAYENFTSSRPLKDAAVKAKNLIVDVTDNTPNGAYGGANGLYINNTKTNAPTVTIDADTATFNVYTNDWHATGVSFRSYNQKATDLIFTGDTTFNVTSNRLSARGINLQGAASGSKIDFQKDATIVAQGKESVYGVYSTSAAEINFSGNTSITAQALEGADPDGTVLAIRNSNGASVRMGVDADGNLNGKTVQINGDIENDKSNLEIGLSGSTSSLTAQVTDNFAEGADTPRMRLLMADGASWFAKGESTVGSVEANNATINLMNADSTVSINSLTVTDQGLNVYVNEVSDTPRVTVATKSGEGRIGVTGSSKVNDSYTSVDEMIQALSTTIAQSDGTTEKSLVDTVTAEEGKIRGEVSSTLGTDGQWQTTVKENVSLDGYSSISSLAALNWRHEMNDLTKRMGELRDSTGKVGAWARAYGSEIEYGKQGVASKNTSIQIGADYALTEEWKLGVAFNYTDGSMTFGRGNGDNKAYGFALYGTWMAENGLFVDLIGKYSRLSTEFSSGTLTGDYDNNGWSFSAEVGWQFRPIDEAFIEPQVELTYGRLEGDTFRSSTGVNIDQKDFDSLIGRAGVRAGFVFPEKKGTVYAKVSVAHDFDGDMESFAYLDEPYTPTKTMKDELGGTWYEFGLGANFNLTDTTYTYVDLQRTTAGNVNETWRWNIGLRHAF